MTSLPTHLRNKMLAGALAAVPIAVVIFAAIWLERQTKPLTEMLGLPRFPGLGILLGLVAIYLLGVAATSLIGNALARAADYLLLRIPGLNLVYRTWKDVLVLPAGKT